MERKYVENVPREIQDLLYDGKKIEAIKHARDELGLDLKSAKEKIERIMAAIETENPGALPKPQGCAGLLIVGLALMGAASFGIRTLLA